MKHLLIDALDDLSAAQCLIDLATMAAETLPAAQREALIVGLSTTHGRIQAARDGLENIHSSMATPAKSCCCR